MLSRFADTDNAAGLQTKSWFDVELNTAICQTNVLRTDVLGICSDVFTCHLALPCVCNAVAAESRRCAAAVLVRRGEFYMANINHLNMWMF